jgi:hypothetical protein
MDKLINGIKYLFSSNVIIFTIAGIISIWVVILILWLG